ncbi:Plasmodium exported protein, unknown function [Plasmodium vivax]|uniref:Pv-fam-b protein n=3 Tax=Plasmodium vivax TaxID=5855 RepID=A0A564ZP06_PLAVI|nr:Plasmodium exported protein, unknown function [Plasmodium vivax]
MGWNYKFLTFSKVLLSLYLLCGTINTQLAQSQNSCKSFASRSRDLLTRLKTNEEFTKQTKINYNKYVEERLKQPYMGSFSEWHDNFSQLVNDNIRLNELEKEVINVHYYTSKRNIFKKVDFYFEKKIFNILNNIEKVKNDKLKSSNVFNKILGKKMFLLFILPVVILLSGFSFLQYGMNSPKILYCIPFAVASILILFYIFSKILKYYIYVENNGKCSFLDYFRIFSKKFN